MPSTRLSLLLSLALSCVSLHAAALDEARRLMAEKRVPEARPLIEQVLAVKDSDPEALLLLGQCQLQLLELEAAVETAEKLLPLVPTDARAHELHGSSCLALAGRKSSLSFARKGRKSLEKALEIDPDNVPAMEMLIGFYDNAPWIAGGDSKRAKELVAQLEQRNPSAGFTSRLGLLTKEKLYAEALSLCEQRLAKLPGDYLALYQFGRLCGMAETRQQEGIAALEGCLAQAVPAKAPGHDGAHFRLALLFQQLKDQAKADQHFEEALRLGAANKDFVEFVKKRRAKA